MDWSAKMLGLSDDFLLEKKKGGGVIMVRHSGRQAGQERN
jgi:hypothetical protein